MTSPGTILLVDEDAAMREVLGTNFRVSGYEVVATGDAEGALAALDAATPDAIVIDGAASVRRIRKHPRAASVPLIVLASPVRAGEAVAALDAGADDVVVRPFAPEEMLARVRGKIARSQADVMLQPLTRLPGNAAIEAEIRRRLGAGRPWSVLYLDLDGFKAYNDAFGFAAGDDVLRLLAGAIVEAVRKHGDAADFVGHVGGDDFVVVATPSRAEGIAHAAIAAFDRGIRIVQRDTRVPLCSVSIAVVSGSTGPTTYERVGERAAAVKKEAKRRPGSVVVTESELL